MKLVRSLPAYCLLMLLSVATTAVAQRRAPTPTTSLFWRISGNGLTLPSYLYGTMHVEHKDVFAFGDSVLAKLQECAAFASEAHPDSFARAYIEHYFYSEIAADTDDTAEEDQQEVEEESATEESGNSTFSPRSRDSWSRRFQSGSSNDPNKDGPVFLDAWFFNLAKNLGKHTLGVETLAEQFALLESDAVDDLEPTGFNIFSAIRAQRDLVEYYKEGNVDKLEELLRETLSASQFDRLLVHRNHIMAERITQQVHVEQTFIAVGAGHLGGDEGVIALLRKRGFTVTPIIPTYTGVADKFVTPAGHSPWFEFHHREGAFSINVPIEPVQYPVDTTNVDPTTVDAHNFHYWVSPDIGGGLYYSFSYSDNPGWTDLTNPSGTLNKATARVLQSFPGTVVREDTIVVFGFPGRDLEVGTEPRLGYRIRLCVRGARLYTMVVTGSKRLLHGDLPDEFLRSFTLESHDPVTWQKFISEEEGFGAEVPNIPITSLNTLYNPANTVVRYYSARDRNSGQAYKMQASHYSKYYQSASPDAFFSKLAEHWTNENEVVVRDSMIMMDGFRGSDILVLDTASGVTSRVRTLLRGDLLYQISSIVPATEVDSNNVEHFFESFHLLERPVSGDLFSSKIDRLFDALESDEEDERSHALRELWNFPFTEADLPRIYKGIEHRWPDDGDTASMRPDISLLRSLGKLKSESSLTFLRDLYGRTDPEKTEQRLAILTVLTEIGTVGSRETLLDLLLQSKERHEECDYNLYQLADSIQTIGHLFPRILELADIPNYRPSLFWLSGVLIESGVVAREVIGTNHIVELCRDAIRSYQKPVKVSEFSKDTAENEPFEAIAAIQLLGLLSDDEESMRVIASTLDGTNPAIVLPAAILLLKHNQPVPSALLERIAADSLSCLYLYRQLSDMKRLDLFPEAYRTQRHFAECLLLEWLSNDEDAIPDEIRYIAQKDVEVDGVRGRVFLFKFRYEDGTWYVGLAGPQPVDRREVSASLGTARSLYRNYDDASIKEHFTILLERHR